MRGRAAVRVAWTPDEHRAMVALSQAMGFATLDAWLTYASRTVASTLLTEAHEARDRRRLRDLATVVAKAYAAGLDEGARRAGWAMASRERVDEVPPLRLVVGDR